ncbi:MAG: DNA repair protein RecO [Patescibacteria group bacterium]
METKTPGIVLKRHNYGEADRICRILTLELGLISALAKGVKKVKSKRGGAFELFSECEFCFHRRTGELFLVTDAQLVSTLNTNTNTTNTNTNTNTNNLGNLKVAYAAAEWLLILLPAEKPVPKTYTLVCEFLKALSRDKKLPLIELAFQTKLLSILGYLPDADKFPEREHKLIKFLKEKDFAEIISLAEEPSTFAKVKNSFIEIFERETEKVSRVAPATHDWD